MRREFRLKHIMAFMLSLAIIGSALDANAAQKTISVSDLHTIVTGMGLEDTGTKDSYVFIDNQGPRNISITMRPVDDNTYIQFYTHLSDIPKEKEAFFPSKKMLEYNDNNSFYFTVGGTNEDSLYLQSRLSAATITPQLLRKQIDAIEAAADETADLWNSDKWLAPQNIGCQSPSTPYAATVTFVTDKESTAADVHKRPDLTFKVDEPFIMYIQPSNFTCVKDGESYTANFSVDVVLLYGTQVATEQKEVIKQEFKAAEPIKTVGLNITDSIKGLIPGKFTFKITTNDLTANKSVEDKIDVVLVK